MEGREYYFVIFCQILTNSIFQAYHIISTFYQKYNFIFCRETLTKARKYESTLF